MPPMSQHPASESSPSRTVPLPPSGLLWLRMRHAATVVLPPALVLGGLVLLWEIVVRWLAVPDWLLPPPSQVLTTLFTSVPVLQGHVTTTLAEALTGLTVGFGVGVSLALLLDASPLLRRTLYPLLVASQTIPIVAIAPLLVIGLGFGLLPKIIVVALITFFPLVVSTADGLQSADRDMVRLVRAMGAGYWRALWLVRAPAALPSLLSGLKIAVTYSVIGAVIAEWIGASSGLGVYISRSLRAFRTDQVFVGALVASLITIALFLLVLGVERWLTRWRRSDEL